MRIENKVIFRSHTSFARSRYVHRHIWRLNFIWYFVLNESKTPLALLSKIDESNIRVFKQ